MDTLQHSSGELTAASSRFGKLLAIIAVFFSVGIFADKAFSQTTSGTYFRSDTNGRGEVKVKIGKGKLTFEIIALGKQKGTCVGEMKGTATFMNATTAHFNPNRKEKDEISGETMSCQFIFIFLSRTRLKVLEKSCEDYHGAACTFQGTYRKRS